jgi:uncharacterized protein
MQPIITSHQQELLELCARFGVRRLEVFGSAAGEEFDPSRSDLDFLVDFRPALPASWRTATSACWKRSRRCSAGRSIW